MDFICYCKECGKEVIKDEKQEGYYQIFYHCCSTVYDMYGNDVTDLYNNK